MISGTLVHYGFGQQALRAMISAANAFVSIQNVEYKHETAKLQRESK